MVSSILPKNERNALECIWFVFLEIIQQFDKSNITYDKKWIFKIRMKMSRNTLKKRNINTLKRLRTYFQSHVSLVLYITYVHYLLVSACFYCLLVS